MANWFSGRRPPKLRALTAAGQRIVPETAQIIGSRRGDWQKLAWAYRTTVPELRYVGGFVNTQLSRVRWFVASAGPEGREPRPLTGEEPGPNEEPIGISVRTQQIAMDALARLDLNSRGSSMAGRGAENFEYAGECYLLGELNEVGQEVWTIRSVSEVRIDKQGNVQLVEPGKSTGRTLNLDEVELFRLWNPDPEYLDWADAKITACLGVLEEIVIYDRQARAAARSRIAAGSLLYVPEELSLTRPGSAPVDTTTSGVDDDEDLFMAELTAGMLTPISSDEDPSAIVPLVVRGPAMGPEGQPMKNLIGVVQIPREEVTDAIRKREAAVTKLAHGMDFPPEIITGIGDANHWQGWIVSDATIKNHLEPRAENFADAITAAYIRETCLKQQCPPDEVARVCVWYDATELSQPADPMGVAKELWDRDVLSDEALAHAGGYEKKDMPGEREKIVRRLSQGRIAPQSVPVIVALEASDQTDPALQRAVRIAEQMAIPTTVLPGPSSKRTVINADRPSEAQASPQAPVPDNAGPSASRTGPPGAQRAVTAGAQPLYEVRERLCRELGAIDQQVVADLGGFIDAAILDIVRQAANRIRSGANRGGRPEEKALFASSSGEQVDAVAVVAAAGDKMRWTVPDQEALAGALDRIEGRFRKAIGAAAKRVRRTLTKLFGRDPGPDLERDYAMRAQGVWPRLAQAITDAAVNTLHGTSPDAGTREEDDPVLPRSALTDALTEVGGPTESGPDRPATGLGAGRSVQDAARDAGAETLGYEWVWHGKVREPFTPHLDLEGTRFASFDDAQLLVQPGDEWIGSHYRPGDHGGCACHVFALFAHLTDEPPEGVDRSAHDADLARLRDRYVKG